MTASTKSLSLTTASGSPIVLPTPDDACGVFVTKAGSASSPGTRAQPLDCPRRAIELATREGKVVFIATGDYEAELHTTVSLFGGYPDDFSALDPEQWPTRILAPGGGHSTTAVSIEGGTVILAGLTLRGGASKHAAAVRIRESARVTLVRNHLLGGGRGPSPDGFTHSHGIHIAYGLTLVLTVLENHIHGGDNQYGNAIDGVGEGTTIERNTIVGGACNTPHSATRGISGRGNLVVRDNIIDAGSGTAATAVVVGGSGIVIGNTITTRSGDGWRALVGLGDGAVVEGNLLDGVPDEIFYAFARKLVPKTWTFNERDGEDWSYATLTLDPWGWLTFTSESADDPPDGGAAPQSQSFRDFLARGPVTSTAPPEVIDEVRSLLRAAGLE